MQRPKGKWLSHCLKSVAKKADLTQKANYVYFQDVLFHVIKYRMHGQFMPLALRLILYHGRIMG